MQVRKSQVKIVSFETIPKSPRKVHNVVSKTIRKKNITNEMILPKIENIRMKGRQSCFLYGVKKLENNLNKNLQNNISDDFDNGSYQKLIELDDNEMEAKSLINKYKGKKIDYLLTDKKEMKNMQFLLSSLKTKINNQSNNKFFHFF